MSAKPSGLQWKQEGVRWLAYTTGRPTHLHLRIAAQRAARAGATSSEIESFSINPFALVRPERGAGGAPDPTTGRWLVVVDAGRLPAGVTSFDTNTTHPSLEAAKHHVTVVAALHGVID